jgi:hypothetical protein
MPHLTGEEAMQNAAQQVAANQYLFSEQPNEEECKAVALAATDLTSTTKLLLALAELYAGEFSDEKGEELLREFAERMADHEAETV